MSILDLSDYEYLHDCPFCGWSHIEAQGKKPLVWYKCRNCGCCGGHASNLKEAQKKWNTRFYVPEAKSLIGIALLALKDHDFLVNNRIAHNETEKVFVASKKHIEEFKK